MDIVHEGLFKEVRKTYNKNEDAKDIRVGE
jgi:hypothetical protein